MKAENFHVNLKKILSVLEVSQTELSEKSGLTQAAISQIVAGKREPSLSSAIRICLALSCTLDRMLK